MAELKKGQGLRQSMAWLHTWSGLLVCWVLFLVFCAGTASYFKDEVSIWMKPELHGSLNRKVSADDAAQRAIAYLQREAPTAERWFVTLPDDRNPAISMFWLRPATPADAGKSNRARLETRTLDAATGEPIPGARDTRGGEFLYRLHFDLHYMPALWARWIIGFCSMFMLVAIISGVITHRRIFADFFTFRACKGQRSWLDAHNAVAVLALPFHLMITYTGLVTLLFLYMPWGIQAVYKGNEQAFNAELAARAPRVKPTNEAAPLAPVGPMLAQASAHWQGGAPHRLTIEAPNKANATVAVAREEGRQFGTTTPTVVFAGPTGELKATLGDTVAPASTTRWTMMGLHVAHFAPPLLRALFFASGLAGCLMVATGALLWAVKTRQSHAKRIAATGRTPFGLRLVEALNLGVIAGLPIAFGAYFWANRLLPVDLAQRQAAEIQAFFGAWAVAALLAQWRPTRAMWRVQLWAGAALFAGLPVLNALTTSTHLGVTLFHGPVVVAGFDLTVLALGVGLGAAARMLGNRGAAPRKAAAPRAVAGVGEMPREMPREVSQ
ncbi:PepSY-associated TM helix domain-containing protein [Cupriavidus sp.]|uniref:PepSY-associated TM helix domain-containing protein n=1 Tax=Cupriavidus sp. TaxID=1873897 RepID=UPI0025C709AA|nr:PepSY-associated TM helix domain-containing protein [Cupriavidus sp.]MCA3188197.1 PepSY domain-containing protein [Cupriavidus sp.]MCA3192038.1 PepSY domain-containing protein [Cupriavidus sp.]MCA3197783.1 PepSY domain-containing protein [Cupriavidus sp.]MCA3202835.1 PepSY domain-containing protein [Cupriavidus sp.]MCA3210387.1 PepSY domain-containing protein [Cupriavidus sp.]